MKILYFGTSSFAIPAMQALVEHGEAVVGVVTQPDRPSGRGHRLTPSPVKIAAQSLSLTVLQPESCRTPEFLELVRSLAPDLTVVASYGQFLPDPLLNLPRLGSVNLHGSLLPKYRGAAPIQRAIWAGEPSTGISLMWMARAMDAGDVIARSEEIITDDDTTGTLTERLAKNAAQLLLRWLPSLATGQAPHFPQDIAAVTFAPPIKKEERLIDWTQPSGFIRRQVKTLSPAPCAIANFKEQQIKICSVAQLAQNIATKEGEPGSITEINPKFGLIVATGQGALCILSLQPAGKRPMSGADFLRGYHVGIGDRFI